MSTRPETRQLVSCAEFARRAGVSSAAITQACKPGKTLAAARSGKRIDAAHPDAVAYIARRQAPEPPVPKKRKPKPPPREKRPAGWRGKQAAQKAASHPTPPDATVEGPPPAVLELPENVAAFADWTLQDIVNRFGTDTAFVDYLKAAKAIEDLREKRLKNAEREGELIPRALVEQHVVGAYERVHINLLTDGAQTIGTRVHAMAKADSDPDECKQFVARTISKMIKAAKADIDRALRADG